MYRRPLRIMIFTQAHIHIYTLIPLVRYSFSCENQFEMHCSMNAPYDLEKNNITLIIIINFRTIQFCLKFKQVTYTYIFTFRLCEVNV